jgi:hypothetical protein
MYRGYQYKMLDLYEVAAFEAAHIISGTGGKKVKASKLFDRRKAEREFFKREQNPEEIREKYRLIKRINQQREVKRNGSGGKG